MKTRYDKDADAMYIRVDSGEYEISEELGDGIVLDISKDCKLLGIEILDASERISKNISADIISMKLFIGLKMRT